MIWIQNVSDTVSETGQHTYAVRINNGPVLATFQHQREHSLSQCLLLASDAVLAEEQKKAARPLKGA